MAGAGAVRRDRPRGVLPGEGRLDPRGEEDLHRLRGQGRVPRVRAVQRRAVRHLGRALRAGAPPAAPPRCLNHGLTRLRPGPTAADALRRRLWSYSGVFTRVASGQARVVREIRAATPLMAALRAPVTACGPWLTAVLNVQAARQFGRRPVAVVVEPHRQGRPAALALLQLRRRGLRTEISLLGDGVVPL